MAWIRGKKAAVLLAVLILAACLCPAMAFAATGNVGQDGSAGFSAQDDPIDLADCEFKFTNGAEEGGDWTVYFVNGPDDAVTPEFALYHNGEEVNADAYTTAYVHSWWDGDTEVFEPAQAPFGAPTGQDGYIVRIAAKDGSGYTGTVGDEYSPSFDVVDAYCLETSYTDVYSSSSEGTQYNINPMNRNYYVVPDASIASFLESLQVRTGGTFDRYYNPHNGILREPGRDYKVSYYRANRAAAAELLVEREGEPLSFAPTEPGTYVLVIKGETPFYGEQDILLDIQGSMDIVEVDPVPNQQYTGKAITPKLSVKYGGKALTEGVDYKVEYKNNTEKGEAQAILTGLNPIKTNTNGSITTLSEDRFFKGTKTVAFKIVGQEKSAQSIKASAKAVSLKAKKLKKKAQTVSPIKVSGAQGSVTYAVASANAKAKKALKLDVKTGKITVKKSTKKGSYKMTVTVKASGNERFEPASASVVVTVKVK